MKELEEEKEKIMKQTLLNAQNLAAEQERALAKAKADAEAAKAEAAAKDKAALASFTAEVKV
jgi:hypothetical protein